VSRRFPREGAGPLVLVLHGPNLAALGRRDPAQYGSRTLDDIMARLQTLGGELGVSIEGLQSDHEGDLVEHSSYALRDAVAAAGVPVIEVHLSNVHARERWRHHLAVAPAARGVIAGLGLLSYELGVRAAAALAAASSQPAHRP
jgi:3-dehydroquinate dehydratase II